MTRIHRTVFLTCAGDASIGASPLGRYFSYNLRAPCRTSSPNTKDVTYRTSAGHGADAATTLVSDLAAPLAPPVPRPRVFRGGGIARADAVWGER